MLLEKVFENCLVDLSLEKKMIFVQISLMTFCKPLGQSRNFKVSNPISVAEELKAHDAVTCF